MQMTHQRKLKKESITLMIQERMEDTKIQEDFLEENQLSELKYGEIAHGASSHWETLEVDSLS